MLLDQDAALRAAELLDYAMFYREAHRRLFRAMVALTEQRSRADIDRLAAVLGAAVAAEREAAGVAS